LQRAPAAQPDLAVPLLYEDAEVIAVEKPAGMPSVALRADDRETIVNYLIARYPELEAIGDAAFEAGLVHRLDTATSGVLVVGRTDAAWRRLRAQFRERAVDKLYLAVVQGRVGQRGTVSAPIAHRPRRPREMLACVDRERAHALRARPALTHYRRLRWQRGAALLGVRIPTGVRHQIRVHLASIGHPVLGDPLYAADAAARATPRLMLHAARIAFAHPADGRRVIIRSRLPDDFQAALRSLGVTPAKPAQSGCVGKTAGSGGDGFPCRPCLSPWRRHHTVLRVVRILDQPVVHVVADLLALDADEVDTLDRLVDALAIEDAPLQLLDADSQQCLVLALDLAPAGFISGKVAVFLSVGPIVPFQNAVALFAL
jgi:23S rRNA pseudouridine1911/1915/1917 synthase